MKPEDPSKPAFNPGPEEEDDDIIDLLDELDQALFDEGVTDSAPVAPPPPPKESTPIETPRLTESAPIDDLQPIDDDDIIDLEDISDESLADVDDFIELTDSVQKATDDDSEMVELVDLVTRSTDEPVLDTSPAVSDPIYSDQVDSDLVGSDLDSANIDADIEMVDIDQDGLDISDLSGAEEPDLLDTIDMIDLDSGLSTSAESDLEEMIDLSDITEAGDDTAPEPAPTGTPPDEPFLFDKAIDELAEEPVANLVEETDEIDLSLESTQDLEEIQIDEIEELDMDDMLEMEEDEISDTMGLDMELDLMADQTADTGPSDFLDSEPPPPPVDDTFSITTEEDIERELGNLIDEQLSDESEIGGLNLDLPDYVDKVAADGSLSLMDDTIDFLDTQDLEPPELTVPAETESPDVILEPEASDMIPEPETFGVIPESETVPAEPAPTAAIPAMALEATPEQLRDALRDVVREMFAEKIEPLLVSVVEEVVSQEINRLKQLLADSKTPPGTL